MFFHFYSAQLAIYHYGKLVFLSYFFCIFSLIHGLFLFVIIRFLESTVLVDYNDQFFFRVGQK